MRKLLFPLLLLLSISIIPQSNQVLLIGSVTSRETGEPLENCNVTIQALSTGTATNSRGAYRISLPPGVHKVTYSFVGYEEFSTNIILKAGDEFFSYDVRLKNVVFQNEEVTVTGSSESKSTAIETIDREDIRRMPNLNSDVLKGLVILPGVKSANEMSSGYNVRGGSFDENLIYLNGFEIFRPYMLRQGIEENQSLINPDLIGGLKFYGGAFPAQYGDKMSSALVVDYKKERKEGLHGIARANLLNSGLSLQNSIGSFNSMLAFRYAYPTIFSNEQQTSGQYSPEFWDIQFLSSFTPDSLTSVEIFAIYAKNKYDLTPKNWTGHFRLDYVIRGISIDYDGERKYGYNTLLGGLKINRQISEDIFVKLNASFFGMNEDENLDLKSDIYFIPDAYKPQLRDYLKSRIEEAENSLELKSLNFSGEISKRFDKNNISAGFQVSLSELAGTTFESINEVEGPGSIPVEPSVISNTYSAQLNRFSGYVQSNLFLFEYLNLDIGLRFTHDSFNGENLFSPRIALYYVPNNVYSINFRWGYYYQPPFFYELKNINEVEGKNILSQKSVHYIAGVQYKVKPELELQLELFYKSLNDLLFVDMNEMRLNYGKENNYEGYSYGFDLLLKGEIVEGMNSWIGYGFLDTGERLKGSSADYSRRILDQSHTLQIFLQDRIKKRSNWQAHTRLIFGSGTMYYSRRVETDPVTNRSYIAVNYDTKLELPHYLRVDMGLSAKFKVSERVEITGVVEVLNVFNNFNIGGYSFYQVIPEVRSPARVPQIYTERFFNAGIEVSF